jgi:hypothetical protein
VAGPTLTREQLLRLRSEVLAEMDVIGTVTDAYADLEELLRHVTTALGWRRVPIGGSLERSGR